MLGRPVKGDLCSPCLRMLDQSLKDGECLAEEGLVCLNLADD